MRDVDVVIPVYGGYQETRRCLETVLASLDFAWARIVIINDCSPDPVITAYLRELCGEHGDLVLLENEHNLGFVATANRGMAYDLNRDVLLLNSDVEVSGNWLTRLRDAAYQNKSVGSLTPFSNNATICSFPNFCEDNRPLFGLNVDQLDDYFAEHYGVDDVAVVPTGVGFCMYLRRDCLNEVGYFDLETFGKGYGEENDWCQRAQQAGWKNLHLASCFVYHKGNVSFGAEHNPRVEKAQQLLAHKHPAYAAAVQNYLAADPFREIRVASLFALLALQDKPKVLFLTHKLGGGAQQHVDELASYYSGDALFLQLTPEEDGASVILTVFDDGKRLNDSLYFDIGTELQKLIVLLRDLGVGHLHFHHTMGLHPRLWLLAADIGCSYDITIHDYYMINGNPTLTDSEARYVEDGSDSFDARCAGHYPLPAGVTAEQWRANQTLLIKGAARLIFPSDDCAARFQRYFKVEKPVVAWHPDYALSQPYPEPQLSFPRDRPLRVLVLGALSREKGADLLEGVALSLKTESIEFHLLGYAYRSLSGAVTTHGPYQNSDVYALVESIEPDVVWFPAVWPETYCYTLSISMHMGLPVVVPNIGAFSERVKGRPLSVVCNWNYSTDDWGVFWRKVLQDEHLPVNVPQAAENRASTTQNTEFYKTEYLQAITAKRGELQAETLHSLATNYHAARPALSSSERILKVIWRLSRTPLFAWIISLIPFRVKQAFKRRLSSKPMHDIVHRS